jgi:hypothetical protein
MTKGRKRVFFEEKNRKTSAIWRVGSPDHVRQAAKIFGFLSFEKKNRSQP